MRKQRREIELLAEFLGYGMEQLHENGTVSHVGSDNPTRLYSAGFNDALQRVTSAINEIYGSKKAEILRCLVLSKKKVYFFDLLNREEYDALQWLSLHGYDGDLLNWKDKNGKNVGITDIRYSGNDLWEILPLSENQAWEWRENCINENRQFTEDFLACNGSQTLQEKLLKVLDSIV